MNRFHRHCCMALKSLETVIIGWGSTYGVIKEAVDRLGEKHSIAMLHFSEIYPFPGTENLIISRFCGRRNSRFAS